MIFKPSPNYHTPHPTPTPANLPHPGGPTHPGNYVAISYPVKDWSPIIIMTYP